MCEIIGYIVRVGLIEDDVPIEDIAAIFQSGVVSISREGVLLVGCPLFLRLSGSPFDIGVFNQYIPVEYGQPDKVTLNFPEGAEISQEVTIYCCIFEIREG